MSKLCQNLLLCLTNSLSNPEAGEMVVTPVKRDCNTSGKTISKSGQEWILPAQLGQLETGRDGKGLL